MKRNAWLTCLVSMVLSFCISFAGVMCLQSAFALQVNISQLVLGCVISAVVFSVGFTVKWWYASLVPVLAAAGWLWYKGKLLPSVEALVYQLSAVYNNAYGSGVVYWSETAPQGADTTLALCLMGCIVAFVCAWVICRRKTAFFALLTAALPVTACFVVTDTVPAPKYLYWLFAGVTLLLLSQLTRRKDPKKGNLLTVLAAVPVVLAVAVLFWSVPQDTYRGQERAEQIMQNVQSWVEDLGEQGPAGTSTAVQQTVELDKKGRLVQTHTPVMTVSARSNLSSEQDKTETLYLRQQGFQTYDGTSWSNEWGNDIYGWIRWDQMEQTAQVMVTTRDQHLMKFVPYYAKNLIDPAEGPNTQEDVVINFMGFAENLQSEYGYTFYLYQLKEGAGSNAIDQEDGFHIEFPIGIPSPDAIALPGKTVEWAEDVVAPLIADRHTVQDRAEAIGAYVRGLARYDKNTARMPAGETDFARWFVEEAESGYCVHYATTAAVLLRAAGIQAQYVEGYVTRVDLYGTAATVYEDQAHAWVEYYDPAVGWRVLEATPSEGVPTHIRVPQGQTPNSPQEPLTPPEQNTPQQNPQQGQTKSLWKGWFWILGALALVMAVILQWQLRLRHLRRRLSRGTANQQAVQLWREIARLSKLRKRRPRQALYDLAQKAKFSQHALTEEELQQLQTALEDCRKALKAGPWYAQPVYTVILAIY